MDHILLDPESLPARLKSGQASKPFGLNDPDSLTEAQIVGYGCRSANFKLLYTTRQGELPPLWLNTYNQLARTEPSNGSCRCRRASC